MNDVMNNWTTQLIGTILIGAAAVAAFWVSEGPESAAVTALIMGGFIAVVHFGRKRWLVTVAQGDPNETLGLLCGIFGASFVLSGVLVARRG
jgi:hypothetical protein